MRFGLIASAALAMAVCGVSLSQAQVIVQSQTVLRPATTVYLPTVSNPVVLPSTPSSVYAPILGSSTTRTVRRVATTTYYAPTTTYYAPTTTYYAPTTTYYAPTTTTYYAPTTTTYYAPTTTTTLMPTTTIVPATTTYIVPTGRRIGLLRPIVVRPLPQVIVTP
jgi:hypothetical protein